MQMDYTFLVGIQGTHIMQDHVIACMPQAHCLMTLIWVTLHLSSFNKKEFVRLMCSRNTSTYIEDSWVLSLTPFFQNPWCNIGCVIGCYVWYKVK